MPIKIELAGEETPKPREPGHCDKCGRFVAHSSLAGGGGPDLTGEYSEVTGVCSEHGRQIVNWERTR